MCTTREKGGKRGKEGGAQGPVRDKEIQTKETQKKRE